MVKLMTSVPCGRLDLPGKGQQSEGFRDAYWVLLGVRIRVWRGIYPHGSYYASDNLRL